MPAVSLALVEAVATGRKSAYKQPAGIFSTCWGRLCGGLEGSAFGLSLTESSSICPIFLRFRLIVNFLFFFLPVETVLILSRCKMYEEFLSFEMKQ